MSSTNKTKMEGTKVDMENYRVKSLIELIGKIAVLEFNHNYQIIMHIIDEYTVELTPNRYLKLQDNVMNFHLTHHHFFYPINYDEKLLELAFSNKELGVAFIKQRWEEEEQKNKKIKWQQQPKQLQKKK